MRSLLLAIMLLIMWATFAQSKANNSHDLSEKTFEVFEWGKFTREMVKVFKAPKEMVIISPKEGGNYPLLFFVHGFCISCDEYTQLFDFIASHGIIVVAPLLYRLPFMSHQKEIDEAADVVNWISSHINSVAPGEPSKRILPDHVTANLESLAVSGHSRGGKTAFALVLGKTKETKFDPTIISALIALDPVAGAKFEGHKRPTKPHVLTNEANSLDISIPTTIIGMGSKSSQRCAPKELNHEEFYKECKQGTHFVLTDYGHCDVLNDSPVKTLMKILCGTGTVQDGSYDAMRRTVGGLMVAFLDAYFGGKPEPYHEIISHPCGAPTKLYYPVGNKVQPSLYNDA